MKINYFRDETIDENRVDVFYRRKDSEITGIMEYLDDYNIILGKREETMRRIFPSEIFYCEIVDRRCYAYLEKEVYQIDFNLRSFQERYSKNGFIQIGKSILVNIYKIKKIKTDLNMKMKLFQENGEILILNRAYKKSFMDYLKKIQEVKNENHR